jgi:hypothetical protein
MVLMLLSLRSINGIGDWGFRKAGSGGGSFAVPQSRIPNPGLRQAAFFSMALAFSNASSMPPTM